MSNISEPNSQHTSTLKPQIHMLRANPPHEKSWQTHHKDYSFGIDPTENTEKGRKRRFLPSYVNALQNPNLKMTCSGLIRLVENLRKTHHTTHSFRPIRLDPTINERNKITLPFFSTTSKPNPPLQPKLTCLGLKHWKNCSVGSSEGPFSNDVRNRRKIALRT